MTLPQQLKEIAAQCGLLQEDCIPTDKLKFYPEVRAICEGNTCRGYGKTWACPPAVGSLEECRARVLRYDKMLLLSKKYDLEDSFDFEGMTEGMQEFREVIDRFDTQLPPTLTDYLLLGNEGCGRCTKCTYPDAPCRFPDKLHPSLEGFGFVVNELAKQSGLRYNNGPDTVTYFGAIFFSEGENP